MIKRKTANWKPRRIEHRLPTRPETPTITITKPTQTSPARIQTGLRPAGAGPAEYPRDRTGDQDTELKTEISVSVGVYCSAAIWPVRATRSLEVATEPKPVTVRS